MVTSAPIGHFTFVLHSHLPYVRRAGRWPHGEEMVHEALAETYLPLLMALDSLKSDGYAPRLTIGLTPILLEQIGDPDVLDAFGQYLEIEIEAAARDERRYGSDPVMRDLARFYQRYYTGISAAFHQQYGRDVVGAFRRLRDEGSVDILTSAATHAYLPLMRRDSTIYGQLKTGAQASRRHIGGRPRGVWLPECAYRPPYLTDEGQYKPGIEEFLADLNLHYFFTETHVVGGGTAVGKVVGDVVGPYSTPRRRVVDVGDAAPSGVPRSVLRPYYVRNERVAVYARDARTGMQVWSAAHGYPGDFAYREFHRKDPESGLQYWRVSGAGYDLTHKLPYDPIAAERQASVHAEHFVGLVADILREHHSTGQRPGLIVSAYDTELFGHWWFEGVTWLREVLRRLERHPDIALTTADEYLAAYPPDDILNIPESSWGAGGDHSTWLNADTNWMWPLIHAAEERMELLVAQHPNAVGLEHEALAQIARELVLVQSSDWPFLISTGQAAEYATERFQQHLGRFNRLVQLLETDRLDEAAVAFLRECQVADNPFPDIDYRVFGRRDAAVPALSG